MVALALAIMGTLAVGGTGGPAHSRAAARLGSSVLTASAAPATPTVAVEGPGNSLWVYWQTPDAQWHGPLGVGAAGSTFSTPSLAYGPTGLPTIAVEGPNHSLYVYWQATNAQWYGPLGLGAPGSSYAAPSLAFSPSGQPTIATEGPSDSLWAFWQATDAQWYGPLGVGAPGSSYAAPSLAFSPSGQPTIATEGPSDSLWAFWQATDAQWYGPLGVGAPGSSYAAPSLAFSPSGQPTIATEGPADSLWAFWEVSGGQWDGPLGVGDPDSTYASPDLSMGAGGLPLVALPEPGNALWVYWESSGGQWNGPLGAGETSSVTVPAGAPYFTMSATMEEGGSGSGYSAYIGVHDGDNDAMSVGIQSDTTSITSKGSPYYIWELVQDGNFTVRYLNPAAVGPDPVSFSWWPASHVVVMYEGSTPVADVAANFVPNLSFSIEGDARENGDSVDDVFTDTQITVGDNCPSQCGLWGTWNTTSYDYYGLEATETNGAAQNGADFTVTGTVSGLPAGGNWGTALVAGMANIPQYWGQT